MDKRNAVSASEVRRLLHRLIRDIIWAFLPEPGVKVLPLHSHHPHQPLSCNTCVVYKFESSSGRYPVLFVFTGMTYHFKKCVVIKIEDKSRECNM